MAEQKVTVAEIQVKAAARLANDGEAEWQAREARFHANGRTEEWIAKRRESHDAQVKAVHDLCQQVLKLNPRALTYPASHGGGLDKPAWQHAAAMLFGLEVQVDWPMQSFSLR